MSDLVAQRLSHHFQAFDNLLDVLTEPDLPARLDPPKHKSIAEHLWCIVGARESYGRALEAGEWSGFACSMENTSLATCREKLASTGENLRALLATLTWTEPRQQLVLDLLEHELNHEAQLIRHLHAVGITPPASWKWA